MRINVKTLQGTQFEINVKPQDTVADVKKSIVTVPGAHENQGRELVIIHQGKVLKDPTTMAENKISENSYLLVMSPKAAILDSQRKRSQASAATPPNPDPADIFPEGLPSDGSKADAGILDILRNDPRFHALRPTIQANPQILAPLIEGIGKENPELQKLILDNFEDVMRLINEPLEGGEVDTLGQLPAARTQSVRVTVEERASIERLEAMGYDRQIVLEAFFACGKNEEFAANYLLDHPDGFY